MLWLVLGIEALIILFIVIRMLRRKPPREGEEEERIEVTLPEQESTIENLDFDERNDEASS